MEQCPVAIGHTARCARCSAKLVMTFQILVTVCLVAAIPMANGDHQVPSLIATVFKIP